MEFVDEGLVPWRPRMPVVPPRERPVDDGGERRVRAAVAPVERRIVAAEHETEQRFVPANARDRSSSRRGRAGACSD